MNFENAPKCPREELPIELQPQSSIRGKVVNYINGIDPRLPKSRPGNQGHPEPVEMHEMADPEAGVVEEVKQE